MLEHTKTKPNEQIIELMASVLEAIAMADETEDVKELIAHAQLGFKLYKDWNESWKEE